MSRYEEIANRWISHAIDPTVRLITRGQSHHNSRIFPGPSGSFADRFGGQSDAIFSYGFHFEIARVLRDGRGRARGVLVNGERASVTTTKHQGIVRSAISRSGLPSVIIPHGALDAAGVDIDSVRALDVTADRWEKTVHRLPDFDPDTTPIVHDTGDSELQRALREAWDLAADLYDRRHGTASWHQAQVRRACIGWHHFAAARDETFEGGIIRRTYLHGYCHKCEHGPDATGAHGWRYPGDQCEHREAREPSYYTKTGLGVQRDERGWFYETSRHWMGESVILADVKREVRVACPDCKGTAFEQDAERYGRNAAHYASFYDGAAIYPARRGSVEGSVYACHGCAGAGMVRRTRTRKNVRFLSGFDHAETQPSYFFCELPKWSRARTIAEAYSDLKPDAVKLAEGMGRAVHRQGDIFAIATTAEARELRATAASMGKRSTNDARVLGTNHCATEVAFMADGTIYARGCLYHIPDGRRNDHARVKLGDGKTWFLLVKNTVPVHRVDPVRGRSVRTV